MSREAQCGRLERRGSTTDGGERERLTQTPPSESSLATSPARRPACRGGSEQGQGRGLDGRRLAAPPRSRSPRCRALRRANPCPPRPQRRRRRRACCARRKPGTRGLSAGPRCPGWPRDGPRQHLVAEPSRAERCVSTGTCPGHVQDMSRACGGWCLSPALRRAPLSLRGDGSLAAVYGDDSLVAALGVELRLSQPFNTQCHDCLEQRPAALSCAARGETSSSSELSRLYLGYISPRGAKCRTQARAASRGPATPPPAAAAPVDDKE